MKPYIMMSQEEKKAHNKKTGPISFLLLIIILISVVIYYNYSNSSKNRTLSNSSTQMSSEEAMAEINLAIEAYDKDDYGTAYPIFQKYINTGSKDGELWYRYAYSKSQIEGKLAIHEYIQAWDYLKNTASSFLPKALNQVQKNFNQITYTLSNAEVGLVSVKFSEFVGDPNYGLKASDGAGFVQIVHSIKNTSSAEISLFTVPGISLYGPNNTKYNRDNLKSAAYNSRIDNPLDGNLNPGIRKNLANVFEVPKSEWEKQGWYIKFGDGKIIPLK